VSEDPDLQHPGQWYQDAIEVKTFNRHLHSELERRYAKRIVYLLDYVGKLERQIETYRRAGQLPHGTPGPNQRSD
jgi:hypothetical protein